MIVSYLFFSFFLLFYFSLLLLILFLVCSHILHIVVCLKMFYTIIKKKSAIIWKCDSEGILFYDALISYFIEFMGYR